MLLHLWHLRQLFVCSKVDQINYSIARSSTNKINRRLGALPTFIDVKTDLNARHLAGLWAKLKNLGMLSDLQVRVIFIVSCNGVDSFVWMRTTTTGGARMLKTTQTNDLR